MNLDFDKQDGLVPAIVQDADTLRVLMLGYMDRAAVEATRTSGRVTFFSRSRGTQWTKGETSGHWLQCVSMTADCDGDTVLVLARPQGPTCHTGATSCFPDAPGAELATLDARVAERDRTRPEGSYTTQLLAGDIARIAQKVGEEGVETALAAVTRDETALAGEAADLVFHLLVLLRARGLGWQAVEAVLATRRTGAAA